MNRNATAIQILRALKAPDRNPNNPPLLWINHERREAGLHDGHYGHVVDYNEAVIARGDPSLKHVSLIDGETFAAV